MSALAAFAQLCALRMQARRCLISLTCATTEWVLTDSGQQGSLQFSGTQPNPGDRPWIGTSSFPRQHSFSNIALNRWRKARHARELPQDNDYYYTNGLSEHSFILTDLRHNPTYQSLDFFRNGPWMRFHCSVPLRDAMGSVLGSLTVLDDKPRYGIRADEMTLLEDISDTIVEHLSATFTRVRRQRGERLISSLGLFHAGEDTLREWWLSQDDIRVLNTGRNVDKGSAVDRQKRVDAEFGSELSSQNERHGPMSSGMEKQDHDDHNGDFSNRSAAMNEAHAPISGAKPGVEAKERQSSSLDSTNVTKRSDVRQKQESGDQFDLAGSISDCYRRASHLLREAMGADGVLFVDAGNVTTPRCPNEHHRRLSASASDGSASDTEGSDSNSERSPKCKVQGCSIRSSYQGSGADAPARTVQMREHYLQSLIKRCPAGFVCYFDQQGQAFGSSSEESSQSSGGDEFTTAKTKKKYYQKLGKIFQGAKALSVYPLWDDGYSRWRSCIFVWTYSTRHCIDQSEDLMFLKTFGNSILAELSRLESVAADMSKATFISSISHELRSPLHGIMGGAELLHETQLTDFQLEMAHAISIAGSTLLDTVNHILDYSKMKNFTKEHQGFTRSERDLGPLADTTGTDAIPNTNLARLTEDVVETTVTAQRLYGGHMQSPRINGASSEPLSPIRHFTTSPAAANPDVSITLNIDYREKWLVAVQPGGWTRILTNLVGNAIKYTLKGHVSIRLSVGDSLGPGLKASRRLPVQLTVEDTGIGMSDTFLAHGMYTPFKQENPYADGTGLGLSIVKHIARSMGAELEISSKLGKGTTAQVRFLAGFVDDEEEGGGGGGEGGGTDITENRVSEWALGLKVDHLQLLPGPAFIASQRRGSLNDPESFHAKSVAENAKEWLACKIINSTSIAQGNGTSVCAITEQHLIEWRKEQPEVLARLLESVASKHSHLFILGQSMHAVTLSPACGDLPVTSVFIHQPIGPRKLLRAIASDRNSTVSGDNTDMELPSLSRTHQDLPHRTTINTEPYYKSVRRLSYKRSPQTYVLEMESSGTTNMSATQSSAPITTAPTSSATSVTSSSRENIPPSERNTNVPGANNTILLVEDNEINMKLLIALVSKLNIPYQCAVNGLEAVEIYSRTPESFFLILMDMSMPVMDGYTATSRIRQEERKFKLDSAFIIAITGVTDAAERQRAFDCGVDDFHNKPVKMKQLQEFVDARLRR